MAIPTCRNLLWLPILAAAVAVGACATDSRTGGSSHGVSTPSTVNQVDAKGFTPLMRAARDGDFATVRTLLSQGADVNAKAKNGTTALLLAAMRDHGRVALELIDAGADVRYADIGGYTPLHWAGWKGNVTVIRKLLASGADVNARTNKAYLSETPLHFAAGMGQLAAVRDLIHAGADVRATGYLDMNALVMSFSGHFESAKELIDNGATVDTRNDAGISALAIAEDAGFAFVAASLKQAGAVSVKTGAVGANPLPRIWPKAPGACGGKDEPELLCPAQRGDVKEVRRLLAAGANVNERGSMGETALMKAAGRSAEVVEILLKAGADFRAKTDAGDTALHFWAGSALRDSETRPILNLLLKAGGNIDQRTSEGHGQFTPLMYAAARGENECVKLLMEAGADVNARDEHGNTALMYAITGHADLQRLLIASGVPVNAPLRDGTTPLAYAKSAGYADVVALLQNSGVTK